MRKSKFTKTQQLRILEAAGKHGFKTTAAVRHIPLPTLYAWKRRHGRPLPKRNGHAYEKVTITAAQLAAANPLKDRYLGNFEQHLVDTIAELVEKNVKMQLEAAFAKLAS